MLNIEEKLNEEISIIEERRLAANVWMKRAVETRHPSIYDIERAAMKHSEAELLACESDILDKISSIISNKVLLNDQERVIHDVIKALNNTLKDD